MDNPVLWTLITIQIAMGAFDTLFHHEGTERLAWRVSQKNELRLHGVRNLFYALIFVVFGWFEPHGWLAVTLVIILAAEVLITLWDFVEEDLTRKLPATERVTHTLLALNYGAILALAAPVLVDWMGRDTAIIPTQYGLWSILASVSALAVGLFGLRDLFAAARTERLALTDAGELVDAIHRHQKILVTGGTGFIGKRLIDGLVAQGHDVSVLTRDKAHAADLQAPIRILTSLDQVRSDECLDAIVNLAGEPVANGLWTRRKRARIVNSRLAVTEEVVRLINRLETKPECLISGSAVGWYGLRGDEALDETASSRECFLHQVCDQWEKAAQKAQVYGVRVILLRTGLVLGVEGGMLARLLTPSEFALGGPIGDGRQWMPWISLDDMVRLIAHGLADSAMRGPINAAAPNPARNQAFTKALACALNRPALMRVPAAPLRWLLGDFAEEMLLGGQRVIPARAKASGFVFKHPNIDGALAAITGSKESERRTCVSDPDATHRDSMHQW